MGRDVYPTSITALSTNIEDVGGKGAFLGMLREDHDGREYVLVITKSNVSTAANTKFIWGFESGGAFTVILAEANGRCDGVNRMNMAAIGGSMYFWLQVYGWANNVMSAGTKGLPIGSSGSGIGAALTVDATVTDVTPAGTTTLNTYAGYVGIGIADSASTLQSIFIKPGFVLI